jgi:hypothetical protein
MQPRRLISRDVKLPAEVGEGAGEANELVAIKVCHVELFSAEQREEETLIDWRSCPAFQAALIVYGSSRLRSRG